MHHLLHYHSEASQLQPITVQVSIVVFVKQMHLAPYIFTTYYK